MARKGLTGQLNMFDLFKSMDDIPMGEVQMVSLMPEDEPEEAEEETLVAEVPQVVEEPEVETVPEIMEKAPVVVEEIKESAIKKEPAPRKKSKKVVEQPVEELPEKETKVNTEESLEEVPSQVSAVKKSSSSGNDKPAMCRRYVIDGKKLEIAYINYNKVRITREGQEPEVHMFESSKDAVDYYVQKMQELEPEEE